MKRPNNATFHFRLVTDKGLLPRGGVTVHYRLWNRDEKRPWQPGDAEEQMVGRFGLAVCQPMDGYCRKTGRIKATARATMKRTLDSDRQVMNVAVNNFKELVAFALFVATQAMRHSLTRLIRASEVITPDRDNPLGGHIGPTGLDQFPLPAFSLVLLHGPKDDPDATTETVPQPAAG